MGSRPLRMKVRWGCPPRVLSPPPHRTQSWRPCLPGQPWASGWRSTDRPVPSPRGWTIGFLERGAAHNRALPRCLSSRRCMRSWRVRGWPLSRPEAARPPPPSSSVLTTLDGGVARGYAGIPQVERAVAVHLCPRNAATWRNRPRLPSKACKLTAALAAKAYSAAGQAASALHAMAILQVHQAKVLKQVHEGSTDPGLMQELRTATDFALRATKITARSLGKAMSTMVVQERHLWLNLAEMKDVDKARFLDAPISQGGLFGCSRASPSSSRRYSSRPRRSSTSCPGVMHHPPLPPGPGLSLPIAVGALLHPPELLRPRPNRHIGRCVEPLAGERHPRVPARPQVVQEVNEAALTRATRRCWSLLFLRRRREQRRSFPRWRAGRRIFCFVLFLFRRWSKGQRYPPSQRKSNFLFLRVLRSMGRQCATPASSLSPTTHFASSQESTARLLSVKPNEWMHLSPFYTRMHGEWLRYAKSTSQFHWRFLLVRDVRGFQVNPLCRHDITSPFPPSGNGGYVRNLDVI